MRGETVVGPQVVQPGLGVALDRRAEDQQCDAADDHGDDGEHLHQGEPELGLAERLHSHQVDRGDEGDFRSLGLFGTYAFKPDLVGYANLLWRASDARQPIFAYREKIARLGIYKSFGNQVTVNAAYGWRHKRADAANMVFGKLQRDNERSLYLNVSLPGYAWHGLVPTATYEYRDNRSTIPHAYNYEKNRLTLGFNKVF